MAGHFEMIFPEPKYISLSSQKLRMRDIVENKLPRLPNGKYRVDWRSPGSEAGMLSIVYYDGRVESLESWSTVQEGIRLVKQREE